MGRVRARARNGWVRATAPTAASRYCGEGGAGGKQAVHRRGPVVYILGSVKSCAPAGALHNCLCPTMKRSEQCAVLHTCARVLARVRSGVRASEEWCRCVVLVG